MANYNLQSLQPKGAKSNGNILNYGDFSVLSFHAKKIFNTFEGGAIVCHDTKIKQRIGHLKVFGFASEITAMAPGINGKMSKHKAAFCFLQLNGINAVLQKRKAFDAHYRKCLSGVKGIHCLADADEKVANYSYFPILVRPEYPLSRDALYEKLRHYDIYAPRYFYSLISDFPIYRGTPSLRHIQIYQ